MNLQKLTILALFLIVGIAILVTRIGEARNIDPQSGYEEGTELCNGYLYAKNNELKSADNCDKDVNYQEMNMNEDLLKGCLSFCN